MADQEHLNILKQGIEAWNEWRQQHPEILPDLREAFLDDADLSFANRRPRNLSFANLSRANLSRALLSRTNLSYTNLSGAFLNSANLRNALLYDANLSGADLSGTNLYGANLYGANLRGARMMLTTITNVDLRGTKGLAEIEHLGRSVVQLDTIQLPQDGSALQFLRGVGVSDEWIAFYQATMMHPIQYYSCFISYSSKDDVLARRLHADLQDKGVRCWFAPEDIKIGDQIRKKIDEAIHLQEKLLLLLSEYALASDWVEDEVEAALEKERRQGREVLFPVRLDECVTQTSQAWAAKLRRTRHIGDFTNWTDPQAYQSAFDRLLRDLKQNYRE